MYSTQSVQLLRRLVLVQTLQAFVFNTVVLALTINFLAGMLG